MKAMNCSDFEMNIYLYEELSGAEKKQLEAHLQTCANCSALFEEIKQAQQYVSQIASEKIIPPNAAKLTSVVMAKVTATKPVQRWIFVEQLLLRAKFAFTALSLMLLISFAVEFVSDSNKPKTTTNEVEGTVVLNAKLFRDAFKQRKKTKRLFAECQSPFKPNQYNLECVKSKMK